MKFLLGILKFILNTLITVSVVLTFLSTTTLGFVGMDDITVLDVAVGLINNQGNVGLPKYVDEESAPTEESFEHVKEQIANESFKYSDLLLGPVYFSEEKVLSFDDSSLASLLNLAIGKDESQILLSTQNTNEPVLVPLNSTKNNLEEESTGEEINFFVNSFTTSNENGNYSISTSVKIVIPEQLLTENLPEGGMGDMISSIAGSDICLKITTGVGIEDKQLYLTSDNVKVDADFVVKALINTILGDDMSLNDLINGQAISIINNLGYVDAATFGTDITKITVRVR